MSTPDGLLWGYKFVGLDLCTDDHQGGRYRYRLGEWHEATNPTDHDNPCPRHPGDGLCAARTLAGAQSGGARLGSSVMLLVGYRSGDVLAESLGKLRVSRLWVAPDPLDPMQVLIGRGAYLTGASLSGAYLAGATLTRANLAGANLYGAYLTGASLSGAYLAGATLTRANLAGANLYEANLTRANLTRVNLAGANLYGAYLTGADLTAANLTDTYGITAPALPAGWELDEVGRARVVLR